VVFGRAYIVVQDQPAVGKSRKDRLHEGGDPVNIIMLQENERPARPDHDLRGLSVLDSNDHELGYVANLYVDEDERHLRYIDVVPQDWLGRDRKNHHHLVPVQALITPDEASRRDMYGSVGLQVDKEMVESSPTLPPSSPAPDSELQEAVLKHYGYD
jgi:sporulation protein YlmC with PRC-barrel domain